MQGNTTDLEARPFDRILLPVEPHQDAFGIGGNGPLRDDPPFGVHHTDRCLVQRHVQSGIIYHGILPDPPCHTILRTDQGACNHPIYSLSKGQAAIREISKAMSVEV